MKWKVKFLYEDTHQHKAKEILQVHLWMFHRVCTVASNPTRTSLSTSVFGTMNLQTLTPRRQSPQLS